MAWTHAADRLNPDRDKIFDSTKFSEPKFSVTLDYERKFHFGASPNQVLFPVAGLCASSQRNPDRDNISVLEMKCFPVHGAINPVANGFKFGAMAN